MSLNENEETFMEESKNEISSASSPPDDGEESQIVTAAPSSLESMGLQPEAEDDDWEDSSTVKASDTDTTTPSPATAMTTDSSQKATKSLTYCEQQLGTPSSHQQKAIDGISTKEGLQKMYTWLLKAQTEQQQRRLVLLLAQCWHVSFANIDLTALTEIPIVTLIRKLKEHPDKDVKVAAGEVIKKWKTIYNNEAKLPPKGQSSDSAAAATSSKTGVSTVAKKSDKATAQAKRPKTVKLKETKRRKTGLLGDEEEENESQNQATPAKKPTSTPAPTRPPTVIPKPTVPKKQPTISTDFMNALSSGTANAMELQKQRKRTTRVIDLPPATPDEPVVTVTTPTAPAAPPSKLSAANNNENGPNPSRVPEPGAKRRIHFADDKGQELVKIKLIENISKAGPRNTDLKHADAESEMLKRRPKTEVEEEEDENEEQPDQHHQQQEQKQQYQQQPPVQQQSPSPSRNHRAAPEEKKWHLQIYNVPADPVEFDQDLFNEEAARHSHCMRVFVQPNVPIDHPAQPDNTSFALTTYSEPEMIPLNYIDEEEEPMDVDDPPDQIECAPLYVSPTSSQAPVITSAPTYQASPSAYQHHHHQQPPPPNNMEILSNFDIHGSKPPKMIPPQFPYPTTNPGPISSAPPHQPPLPSPSSATPLPVPAPASELLILSDNPSTLNSRRQSAGMIDKEKMVDLQRILSKVNQTNKSSVLGAAPAVPPKQVSLPDTSRPPPGFPPAGVSPPTSSISNAPPSQSTISFAPVPPPVDDIIEVPLDIHSSAKINTAPPKPSGFAPPHGPPGGGGYRPRLSSGNICRFFLNGTCKFGDKCNNQHVKPNQAPMNSIRGPAPPRFSSRGGFIPRGGRFNSNFNPRPPYNPSAAQKDDENYSRSDSRRRDVKNERSSRDDYRRSSRYSRSPSPRRSSNGRRRSRSRSPPRRPSPDSSPENRYRRRTSRSRASRSRSRSPPHAARSRSRSPIPRRRRSPSRSPIRSPSPK